MLASWAVFPFVLGVLALGCGLLVEHFGRIRFAGGLVVPVGLAAIIVIGTAVSVVTGLRPLACVVVAGLAAGGFALRRGRLGRPSPWLAGAVLVVFVLYGAPALFSGQATFVGYSRLDDSATFLALTARLIDRGRDASGLAPSTYARTIEAYIGTGYPVGSLVPLGVVAPLVRQNLAWLFQPYLTVLAALLATCLWALTGTIARRASVRAGLVIVASQPALLFAYANEEGAVKEMTMAVLFALTAALTAQLLRREVGRGPVLAAAVAAAAMLDTYSLGALPWLGPLGLAVAVSWGAGMTERPLRRKLATAAVAGLALVGVLALPALGTIGSFAHAAGDLRAPSVDLGNLTRSLSPLQLLGVWPAGDFRTGLGANAGAAGVLIAGVAATSVLGLGHAIRRRSWEPTVYGLGGLVAFLVVNSAGSAWVTAKVMAVVSPAVLLLAGAGALAWARRGARVIAPLVGLAIAAGVLWSNVLAYEDAALAPRDRLAELAQIGADFAGQGPALLNEYEPYGARFFLRTLDAEAPAELRVRRVELRDGTYLPTGQPAYLDQFALSSLRPYRTLIVRRNPTDSRPPAFFDLKRTYRYYEVWQQPAIPRVVVTDMPLRRGVMPAAVPDCRQVARLARIATADHAELVAAPDPALAAAALGSAAHPASWSIPGDPEHLNPASPGTARLALTLPRAGDYGVWLGGSFARGVSLSADGRPVGAVRYALNPLGQYDLFGRVSLSSGVHHFALRYPGAGLHPGSAQQALPLGPLVLQSEPRNAEALVSVAPDRASTLCGRPLAWIEVVRARA